MAAGRKNETPMAMRGCKLDHLVVTAPDLRSGIEWVRGLLGAEPQPGGEHREMGTHNCLLRLGESAYLEVIARNPDAYHPGRPRWFGLDHVNKGSPPRLAAWVVRTPDLRSAQAACSEPLGKIERMSRGDLEWLITIPEDGNLPLDGAVPMLIEWPADTHPVSRLPDAGCTLLRLEVLHPQPDRVSRVLESVAFAGDVSISALPKNARPRLVAHVHTAQGETTLGGVSPAGPDCTVA
ncbi:MAG TPA: VOC family protein [Burkholderiales bacterium]|nr:VOC family protein [Burkholderiales bacterium]